MFSNAVSLARNHPFSLYPRNSLFEGGKVFLDFTRTQKKKRKTNFFPCRSKSEDSVLGWMDVYNFMCAVCTQENVVLKRTFSFEKYSSASGALRETFAEGELRNNKFHVVVAFYSSLVLAAMIPLNFRNCSQ
jgi:hypothetical protein